MNRASPVEMRKALEMVETFKQYGILFVAVPVLNADDHVALVSNVSNRLIKLETEAEQ